MQQGPFEFTRAESVRDRCALACERLQTTSETIPPQCSIVVPADVQSLPVTRGKALGKIPSSSCPRRCSHDVGGFFSSRCKESVLTRVNQCAARSQLSAPCNIDYTDDVAVILISARHTRQPGLNLQVLFCHVCAARARAARVVRRYREQHIAGPSRVLYSSWRQGFAPALVEN